MQRRIEPHSLSQVLEADLQAPAAPEALEVDLLVPLVVIPEALEVGLLPLLVVTPEFDFLLPKEAPKSDFLAARAVFVVVPQLLADPVHPQTQAVPVCLWPVS